MHQNNLSILKQTPIFAGLDAAELNELSLLAVPRDLVENEYVFWEGDPSDRFYIIAAGNIKVSKLASTGKETILAFFGPGEIFGEAAVFEDKAYPATAQATTSTRLVAIKKSALIDFLARHPPVTLKIIGILSNRLRESQSRLRDLAGERVEQRLARILIMLSDKLGDELPFTRQEISDMSGTTTETTIRILSHWKERGITSSVRGKIILSNKIKLRLLAEGPPSLSL